MSNDKPEQRSDRPDPVVTPKPAKPVPNQVAGEQAQHDEAHRVGVEAVERALTGAA